MDQELDALLTHLQGDVLALKLLFAAMLDVIRARDLLTEGEIAEIFDSVLSAAERQPQDDLREVIRRSVERLMRQ